LEGEPARAEKRNDHEVAHVLIPSPLRRIRKVRSTRRTARRIRRTRSTIQTHRHADRPHTHGNSTATPECCPRRNSSTARIPRTARHTRDRSRCLDPPCTRCKLSSPLLPGEKG